MWKIIILRSSRRASSHFRIRPFAASSTVPDIVHASTIINAREQRPIELYAALAVIFFVICYGLSRLVTLVESKTSRRIFGDAKAA